MNPNTIMIWAKVILLVAFLLMSPIVVGSVYAGFIILHYAAKYIQNTLDRYVAMSVASLFAAFIAPMFFATHPGFAFCLAFAAFLVWVFTPFSKDMPEQANDDSRAFTEASEGIIDIDVISVKTVYH